MKRNAIMANDGNRWRAALLVSEFRKGRENLYRVRFFRLRQLRSGRWAFVGRQADSDGGAAMTRDREAEIVAQFLRPDSNLDAIADDTDCDLATVLSALRAALRERDERIKGLLGILDDVRADRDGLLEQIQRDNTSIRTRDEEIRRLRAQLARGNAGLDEALNMGDGSYRP